MTNLKHWICENCKKATSTDGHIPICKCESKQGKPMTEIKR